MLCVAVFEILGSDETTWWDVLLFMGKKKHSSLKVTGVNLFLADLKNLPNRL